MPELSSDLSGLERRRSELFGLIAQVGDFRRGALNAVRRKFCLMPAGAGPEFFVWLGAHGFTSLAWGWSGRPR